MRKSKTQRSEVKQWRASDLVIFILYSVTLWGIYRGTSKTTKISGSGFPYSSSEEQLNCWVLYIKKGFPGGSVGKESTCNAEGLGSVPSFGRSPGAGHGNPLQYSGLENSMDCIDQGVAKSQTRLSDFQFHFHPWERKTKATEKKKNCNNGKLSRRHN